MGGTKVQRLVQVKVPPVQAKVPVLVQARAPLKTVLLPVPVPVLRTTLPLSGIPAQQTVPVQQMLPAQRQRQRVPVQQTLASQRQRVPMAMTKLL
jgi:hypothetical protein